MPRWRSVNTYPNGEINHVLTLRQRRPAASGPLRVSGERKSVERRVPDPRKVYRKERPVLKRGLLMALVNCFGVKSRTARGYRRTWARLPPSSELGPAKFQLGERT